MRARRRVIAVTGFLESADALGGTPEVSLVIDALIKRAVSRPEAGAVIPGFKARMIKSRSYGIYPALRLIYALENDVVSLYDVSTYDELAD